MTVFAAEWSSPMSKKEEFDYIWTDKKRTIFGLPLSFTRYFLTETKFITRTGFLSIDELYTVKIQTLLKKKYAALKLQEKYLNSLTDM